MYFLPSRPRRSFLHFRSSFNLDSLNPAFEELSCHVAKGHPLDAFICVDMIDDSEDISVLAEESVCQENIPFVHLDDLWLATDLWMDRHGKDKAVIVLESEVKLFEPQSLYFVGTDESVLRFGSVSSPAAAIKGEARKGVGLTVPALPGIGCRGGPLQIVSV